KLRKDRQRYFTKYSRQKTNTHCTRISLRSITTGFRKCFERRLPDMAVFQRRPNPHCCRHYESATCTTTDRRKSRRLHWQEPRARHDPSTAGNLKPNFVVLLPPLQFQLFANADYCLPDEHRPPSQSTKLQARMDQRSASCPSH